MKAFPSNYDPQTGSSEKGMELRDYFAGQIMQDMFEEFWTSPDDAARFAYKFADAMMKARNE